MVGRFGATAGEPIVREEPSLPEANSELELRRRVHAQALKAWFNVRSYVRFTLLATLMFAPFFYVYEQQFHPDNYAPTGNGGRVNRATPDGSARGRGRPPPTIPVGEQELVFSRDPV